MTVKLQVVWINDFFLSDCALDAEGNVVGGRFADGIVPSLTMNYEDDTFEAEWYSGYYAALRQRNGDASLDFLHLWLNAGYKFSEKVSAGGHFELLENTRNTYPGGTTGVTYEWLGAYIQFELPQGFFARFTGGADTSSGGRGDFYKLGIGFSFLGDPNAINSTSRAGSRRPYLKKGAC